MTRTSLCRIRQRWNHRTQVVWMVSLGAWVEGATTCGQNFACRVLPSSRKEATHGVTQQRTIDNLPSKMCQRFTS